MRDVTPGAPAPERPELRHSRRDDVVACRVRADINDSNPPIWRQLLVRSDLNLDVVHPVMQAAFDWDDYHLYRFALGGDPFDLRSQVFSCARDLADLATDSWPPASRGNGL